MRYNKSLILGNAPSSGSSLLVSLLGTHPDIFQTGELNIFDKADWCADRTGDLKHRWLEYARRRYDLHFPFEHAAFFNNFDTPPNFPDYEGGFASFAVHTMKQLALEAGVSSFVEKTPNNIFSIPHIHSRIEDVRFVMIVRHPVSVYKSLRKRNYDPFTSVARWYFPNLVVNAMGSRERTLVIRYEDLTSNPYEEIKRVFEFLDIPAPSKEVTEDRGHSDVINVSSWTNDVRGPVVRQPIDNVIPDEMVEIFDRIRAREYFYKYCGIDDPELSPLQLAQQFGYQPKASEFQRTKPSARLFPWRRYGRYLISSAKHRRRVRPLWHRWT